MEIRVSALGSISVSVNGTEAREMRARPVRFAVLLYLALEREASREGLMALLWPESDRDHARQALRQTLYALRQDLGEEWLEADRDILRATACLTADAEDARRAMETSDLRRFRELYRGHFLEGLHLAQSQPFQLWCDRWRARLQRMNRQARRTLIDEEASGGDPEGALREARRWLDLDPLEDEAQHRVLEILSRLGRGEEALQEYESYAALLAREGLEPLEETRTLMAEVRASHPGIAHLPLGRGRGAERVAIDEPVTGRRRRFRVLGAALAVVTMVGIGAGILLFGPSSSSELAPDPTRVLVLPPDNETEDPDLDDLGLLAQEWITDGVARMGPLRAVPALDVLQMLRAGMTEEAAAVGRNAGTLVSGRFFRVGSSLEFHIRISDLVRGEVWHALDPVAVSPVEPEPGLRELKDRVAGSLAVRFIPGSALPDPSLLDPPSYPAFQAVMDAAEFLSRGDWTGALPHAERAARLDTTFYRARLFVAAALINLGEHARADSVLEALAASRDRFSEYERLVFQSGAARLRGDWEGRLTAAREGARLDPGGTLHYSSASVALAAGRPGEALALYSTLDPHCPWAPDIVWPWSHWTGSHHLLGLHQKELEEARRARGYHPDRLEALFLELRALAALGRTPPLLERLSEVQALPPEPGWNAGVVLVQVAAELRAHGHGEEAARVLSSGLEWYQTRPEDPGSERFLGIGYADALFMAGRLSEAEVLLKRLWEDRPDDVSVVGRMSVVYARLGSASQLEGLIVALESTRGPYSFGTVDYWRAAVAAWSGREEEAVSRLRRSISDGHRRGIALHADRFLEPLWPLPAFSLAVAEES